MMGDGASKADDEVVRIRVSLVRRQGELEAELARVRREIHVIDTFLTPRGKGGARDPHKREGQPVPTRVRVKQAILDALRDCGTARTIPEIVRMVAARRPGTVRSTIDPQLRRLEGEGLVARSGRTWRSTAMTPQG